MKRPDVDDVRSMDRSARVASGRSVGLVLGGGGARTFAHIGALAAFRDAGVPIDWIGGCSGGAMFGALHAMGWSSERMREAAWRHFVARGSPVVPTFSLVSLISERPFLRILDDLFGDTRIEDLSIPYFSVSANLTRRELRAHRTGRVRDAVRASMSVPGIAPPHVEAGEIFVDGCVLDPLPVATMRELGAGLVIGIDVAPRRGPSVSPHLTSMPSLWDLAKERIVGRVQTRVAFWWDVLLAAALSGGARDDGAADLVIRPSLEGGSLLGFQHMDALAAAAYRDVAAALRSHPLHREAPPR